MRCAHAHTCINSLYDAHGLPQGSSLEKKTVSGGIRGKSVKGELISDPSQSLMPEMHNTANRHIRLK